MDRVITGEAVRIVTPHDKNAEWHESIIHGTEPVLRRDRIGRVITNRVMGSRWLNVRCNNTSCPAQILIREQDLLKDVIGR